MKLFLKPLALVLLWAVAVPGISQDKPVIPYVDRNTAQALVDTLTNENDTLKAEADKLRKEAASLTQQITFTRKSINDLVPLLEEVKARNAEMASLSEDLVDRSLKAKSLSAAEKNRAGEKKVAKRIDELVAKVIGLGKQVESRLFQAAVNDARVNRNTDDIVLLQATLSKTKVQEAQLQIVIDQIEALSTRVDSILLQSNPAP